ncbi:MAG TPA: twin-arginine translocase TatA/TatE family subunit [Candidatus Acidoferrum sp.]|nr:twin-arginine translocase TatA/TatE family subunit [Candidatus Acidoferrum sp.]
MVLSNVALLDFGAPELLIILAILLLIVGGKRLPELARSIGTSARELRKGMSDPAEVSTNGGDQQSNKAE